MTVQRQQLKSMPSLSIAVIFHISFAASAFLYPHPTVVQASRSPAYSPSSFAKFDLRHKDDVVLSSASTSTDNAVSNEDSSSSPAYSPEEKNAVYISGLLDNLGTALDKYICTGALATRTRAFNIIKQVEREAMDENMAKQAKRMASRAGMPLDEPPVMEPPAWSEAGKKENAALRNEMQASRGASSDSGSSNKEVGRTDASERMTDAQARQQWEEQRTSTSSTGQSVANRLQPGATSNGGRSALSRREANNGKPDLFMPQVTGKDQLDRAEAFANDKQGLENELLGEGGVGSTSSATEADDEAVATATRISAELVASAGAGSAFEGETLGIGGLDEVLAEVKRRIWVPLAAPPELLDELGINPVRGLLLYGKPGCGKTLLARTIGKILSPSRPITVVSGPEIMDKFVGSSEKNLRAVFDNPPDIYETFRLGEADGGTAMSQAALHVIVMDEFDAMARTRGGRGGKGDQGDAGVARDSVVNQMLAKMDGVDPLIVPTLVIGLTNKRSLVEPALLRPGRFEVQIEVPPPKSVKQRTSILKVHTNSMYNAGRVLVKDAPQGTAAARRLEKDGDDRVLTYDELLDLLAVECDGMSGAMIAGVARAAASHALERAVCNFSEHDGTSIMDCLVTQSDFEKAIEDVFNSSGDTDFEEESDTADSENGATGPGESPDDSADNQELP
mmetsp:Transcript_22171/g.30867  ORF Transcript_22171/g.30867 Transcript_22171/m.30867 type:complete len:679 (+) Transcript_22171:88-2124(+)